jgi:hypothetical protein
MGRARKPDRKFLLSCATWIGVIGLVIGAQLGIDHMAFDVLDSLGCPNVTIAR